MSDNNAAERLHLECTTSSSDRDSIATKKASGLRTLPSLLSHRACPATEPAQSLSLPSLRTCSHSHPLSLPSRHALRDDGQNPLIAPDQCDMAPYAREPDGDSFRHSSDIQRALDDHSPPEDETTEILSADTAADTAAPAAAPANKPSSKEVGAPLVGRHHSSSSEASACETPVRNKAPVEIRLQHRIGAGTFGTVYQGKMNGEIVAVKRVEIDPQYVNRELQIMQMFVARPHRNVIATKHSHVEHNEHQRASYCFMVMPLYPMSLGQLISQWASRGRGSEWKTKLYAYQLVRALAHIHGMGICHRDLKPQNVMVNPSSGELVLCDFGSSKVMDRNKSTAYIASRFYRAPECILENEAYTSAIDIWALGCVIAEMVLLRPLFDGMDSTDQLYLMFKARGTPSFEDFTQLNPSLEASVIEQLLKTPRSARSWSYLLRTDKLSRNYTALLSKLLQYSPTARPQARHVHGDAYFDRIRGLTEMQREQIGLELFDFTEEEMRGPPALQEPTTRTQHGPHRRQQNTNNLS